MLDCYPETLHYGDSVRFSTADICYYRGRVYSLLSDEENAIHQFKKGALEYDDENLVHNERNRNFSFMCMAELKKRWNT